MTSLYWDGEHTQKTTRKKFKDKAYHVWQSFGQVAPELRLEHTKREDEVEEEEEKTDKWVVLLTTALLPACRAALQLQRAVFCLFNSLNDGRRALH